MIWAKIAQLLLSIADTLTSWAKQTSDQNIGRKLQAADDATASMRQATNATIFEERNAALDGPALDDKLRRQTGVDP